MIGKKILLLCSGIILTLSFLHGQKPFYEVIANVDTSNESGHVITKINIPSELNIPGDTVWFHLWANAYSNTGNEFTEEQLKYGFTTFYFREETKLSKISDIKITENQNPVSFVFKDQSKEILGVIVGDKKLFSGTITIEYNLRLPALINGLGYETGNYYLRNFYPKLVRYENKVWQTYQYRQFVDEWGYNSDVMLKLYGMEGFVPFSNGTVVNVGKSFEISAKNVKELAIVVLKSEHKNILSSSENENFSYRLISVNEHSLNFEVVDTTIQKVAFRMSQYLGKFPNESLTILIGKGCNTCFKTDGMVMVNEPIDEKGVEKWLVSILSDVWVSSKFDINAESYPWLLGGLTTYFGDIYQQDSPSNIVKEYGEYKNCYFPYLYQYQRAIINEPLNANRNMLDKDLAYLNRYHKSAAFLHYLSALVGKNIFSATLAHFIESKEPLTPDSLIAKLEQNSGLALKGIAASYISKSSETDYKIHGVNYIDQKWQLSAENLKADSLRFILTVENSAGEKTDFLVNGFVGKKNIPIEYDGQADIKTVSIDKAGYLPEVNRENNHYFPKKTFKHGPIKLADLFKDGDSRIKELRVTPFPLYNDNDGVMLGINFTNSNFDDIHTLSFAITPVYSFRNKKILGQSWVNYDQYRTSSVFGKISYRVGLKSFDMNTNKNFDYSQRYIRLDPSATFHFKHNSFPAKQSFIALKAFFIQEEYPLFKGGVYDVLQSQNSAIYRMEYDFSTSSVLSSTDFNIGVEQQSYDQPQAKANYLKITGVFNQRFKYSSRKDIWFRCFASGFLINTQRESGSYQNIFSKGSIALIHQGFNDYTYDEYYFSRQNQTRLYDNQTSIHQGGGFKTPLGSSNSYAMSNNFAAAINISSDIPFRLPRWLPLRGYFDVGTFSTYDSINEKFKNNIMYNGGISLNYEDIIAIHLPLFSSQDLDNLYSGQHKNIFSRISFSLDLHKLDIWKGRSFSGNRK
jgi:hypothetical protein